MDYIKYFSEINKFIMDSKNGYYYKAEYKLKWRTIVIKYINLLTDKNMDSDLYNQATDLLYRLFNLLFEATNGRIFISNNIFKDINNDEVNLYNLILNRYFRNYEDVMTERLLLNCVDICLISKRFVLWPIYLFCEKIKDLGKLDSLCDIAKSIYKKYYKEFKKNNTNQLFLEYLMYDIVIIGYLNDNLKKIIDYYYYSNSVIDKEEAFESLAYIALSFENKQFFMYVYVDGNSRRVNINDEIKKEYDSIGINK
ncbi:MAG: hypothetical protein IKP77_00770 [Acholeplasmatales bacterium]|nr:hypothetical protein [Acholeplasmatales bacterium]